MFTQETHLIIRDSFRIARAPGNVSGPRDYQDLTHAIIDQHPLLVGMDALLKAARTYRDRCEGAAIADDELLGPDWLQAALATRRLLNGDFGPVHNGTVEAIFWKALDVAGFTEADIVGRKVA